MIKKLLLIVAFLAGLLVVGGIGTWMFVTYTTTPMSWPVEEFSASAWQSSAPQERYVFYRDLAKSRRLNGANRREVLDLLGPPDFEASSGSYMTWVVKHAEPEEWSFDSIYILDIRFDPTTSKVREYLIRSD